ILSKPFGYFLAIDAHFLRTRGFDTPEPALIAAAHPKIGGGEQNNETEFFRPPDHPGSMIEIFRIEIAKGIAVERFLAIGIGRRMAGELVFDKIDQNGIEAALSAVLQIGLD